MSKSKPNLSANETSLKRQTHRFFAVCSDNEQPDQDLLGVRVRGQHPRGSERARRVVRDHALPTREFLLPISARPNPN